MAKVVGQSFIHNFVSMKMAFLVFMAIMILNVLLHVSDAISYMCVSGLVVATLVVSFETYFEFKTKGEI